MNKVLYTPALLVLLIGAACVRAPLQADDDSYTAPNGLFSCAMPPLGQPGAQVDEQFGEGAFSVAFTDDFGKLYRIDAVSEVHLPPDWPTETEAILGRVLDSTLATYQSVAPGTTVIRRAYLPDELDGTLFAVVKMPGGSTISRSVGGGQVERLDAIRSTALFINAGWVVQVSSQLPPDLGSDPGEPTGEELELLQDQTLSFAATIIFAGGA